MKAADLYDADFAEWALHNAALLRSGRAQEADLDHIAEEIEAMAKRERRALYRRLYRLIEHLLTWQFQPSRRGASWQKTIIEQRRAALRILEESPSLRPKLSEVAREAYADVIEATALLIRRPFRDFPAECPYSIEQLLDTDYLPS